MTRFGYTLFSELNGPKTLVSEAVAAEEAGFDFEVVSDHFHPWLESHSDSPFAWSVLGAVAERTSRVDLATLVTCPIIRYHPAVIAQAAATMQIMSDGRFTLGLGAGERLNEHVVGKGWPSVTIRHEMLTEAVEIMRLLWDGGFCSYRGRHLQLEDARLYTLPDQRIPILIAGSGPASVELAAGLGDGFVAIADDAELVSSYREASGGSARSMGQVALCYDTDQAKAVELAHRFKFGISGWKVMAELPNPVNFEAATAIVRDDDITGIVACGPDPQVHLDAINGFVEAGYDEVAVVQVGDDKDGFFRFWRDELAPNL